VNVEWDAYATDDWTRLEYEDAERVARAVDRWSKTGEGVVDAAEGGGVFRLYTGAHVVLFLIDTSTDTMHVVQVRRA
jgi:mRNA-degrading endonuclease RelE of RelBE toxin-antitoxin system